MGFGVKNDYSADNLIGKVYSKYQTTGVDTNVTDGGSNNYLDFDGYLKLLGAQMANQDFNNAMSDSEFIQQMASYTMMDTISKLSQQTALSYSASLIGKAVTVDGGGSAETGIVETVTITSEGCKLLVNGNLYNADKITDVVDGDVYKQLRTFVGHKVELKSGEETISGKVTGIIIKNGIGYVTIDNGDSYDIKNLTKLLDAEEEGTEGAEGAEGAGSAEGAGTASGEGAGTASGEGAGTASGEGAGSATVNGNASGTAYTGETAGTTYSSQAVYETLMRMIDGDMDDEATLKSAQVNSKLGMSRYMSASVNESAAAAGLASDTSILHRIPRPYSAGDSYSYQDSGYGYGYDDDIAEELMREYGTSNIVFQDSLRDGDSSVSYTGYTAQSANSVNSYLDNITASAAKSSYDKGEVSGVTTVKGSNAESTSLYRYAGENRNSYSYSNRKYADKYPVEAAFADSVGTKMVDIRFIGNNKITSRIDTSEILGYTESGRAFTDIGWSGRGYLGEVVTFANGTQRVEIISPMEVSYLYTSGRYTLDEICNFNCPAGSLVGKLNASETAIRHYAREYTAGEKAAMRNFENYARANARTLLYR